MYILCKYVYHILYNFILHNILYNFIIFIYHSLCYDMYIIIIFSTFLAANKLILFIWKNEFLLKKDKRYLKYI